MGALEQAASDHVAAWKMRQEVCIGTTRSAYRKDSFFSAFITMQCAPQPSTLNPQPPTANRIPSASPGIGGSTRTA